MPLLGSKYAKIAVGGRGPPRELMALLQTLQLDLMLLLCGRVREERQGEGQELTGLKGDEWDRMGWGELRPIFLHSWVRPRP